MKYLKKFNEMLSIPTILVLSVIAGVALIKMIIKILSRKTEKRNGRLIVSRLKYLLTTSLKVKITKVDNGHLIETSHFYRGGPLELILSDSPDHFLIINDTIEIKIKLSNKEYSDMFNIINKYQKIDKPLYPKVATSSVMDSKFEAGLYPFSKEELRIVKSNIIDKEYKLVGVMEYNLLIGGKNIAPDCSDNKAIGLQKDQKSKNDKDPEKIIILKNVDDWFIITELYSNWERHLICDQFEELENYIKSL